ncbi:major royal jelly protein 1 [Rhagoletis pomonella]|uniref:major royal jelly protein 1 n=1 Tax=Rhagoletis pomonella TaxID=28610 RepID=UPI00177B1098|nr:major royal jelly protein 1 [Rhagoletis pomonella]
MMKRFTTAATLLIFAIVTAVWLPWTGVSALAESSTLQTAKQWKLFTYNFLPHAPIHDLNFYNPSNVLATGITVSHDRIFIATPKLFSGVSSTVNVVSKAEFGDSPVLQAYPDWSFSTTGRTDFNCSDLVLVSVYRMRIDSCNRLWLLDAGVSRSLEDFEVTCPPKILIIDLNTDQVVRRVDFPKEILRGESLFTNLVIDETTAKHGNCDDVFAYITDTVEPGIIVYDSGRDVTWRVSHPAMYPDPDFAQSEILNDRFILMDGVVGLAFDPKLGVVYFQPLATDRLFSVTKEVLRAGPLTQNEILKVKLVGKKSSQGIGLTVSPVDGSIIFSPLTETAIAAWNPRNNNQLVLAHDRERLQFVADMATTPHEPGVIYAVSSKFHRFFLKNLNHNEVNNRVLRLRLTNDYVSTHGAIGAQPYDLHTINKASNYFGSPYKKNSLDQTNVIGYGNYIYNSLHAGVKSQPPYNFETVGLINFSLRNPFTALNAGEAFPPRKEQRSNDQRPSYLDSLNGERSTASPDLRYHIPTTTLSPILHSGQHTSIPFSVEYDLPRRVRNAEGQEIKGAIESTTVKQ